VLDAVARIETALERQKQTAIPAPDVAARLTAALGEARQRVLAALARDDATQAQDTIRKGARVIRDVAWTLRECGADVRICDLLDAQVAAINTGCERHAALTPSHAAISALFDDLDATLQALLRGEAPPSSAAADTETHAENTTPCLVDDGAADVVAAGDAATGFAAADDHATASDLAAMPAVAPAAEAITAPAAATAAFDTLAEPQEPVVAKAEPPPSSAMPTIAPDLCDHPGSTDPGSTDNVGDTAPPAAPAPSQSLGAAILRSGLIDQALPERPRGDPLAPLRKLSQAEKIALFS
jgi:hypothetical protein